MEVITKTLAMNKRPGQQLYLGVYCAEGVTAEQACRQAIRRCDNPPRRRAARTSLSAPCGGLHRFRALSGRCRRAGGAARGGGRCSVTSRRVRSALRRGCLRRGAARVCPSPARVSRLRLWSCRPPARVAAARRRGGLPQGVQCDTDDEMVGIRRRLRSAPQPRPALHRYHRGTPPRQPS